MWFTLHALRTAGGCGKCLGRDSHQVVFLRTDCDWFGRGPDVRAPWFRAFSEFSPTFGPKMFQKQVPLSRLGANNCDFLLRITDDTNSPVTESDATLTHVGLGQLLALLPHVTLRIGLSSPQSHTGA